MKKITSILVVLIIACFAKTAFAQPSFNHLALYVVDLNKSGEFYDKVMMLQRIPEPFHDSKHIWYSMGAHNQLHVISGAKEMIQHDENVHLALRVDSVEAFAKHLDDLGIKYGNWNGSSKQPQVRADGIKQIYFQDPDGYWIEVNNDKF